MYGYGNYGYGSSLGSSELSGLAGLGVWMIISVVIAIAGGIVVYALFLKKENENKFTGFTAWLYDFLSFKKMLLEVILKVCYLITAIYLTLFGLGLLSVNILTALLTIIFGNVIARIAYEFSLILLTICRNTTEINKKLKSSEKSKKKESDED